MKLNLQLFGGRGGGSGVATAGGSSMQDTYGQMAVEKSNSSNTTPDKEDTKAKLPYGERPQFSNWIKGDQTDWDYREMAGVKRNQDPDAQYHDIQMQRVAQARIHLENENGQRYTWTDPNTGKKTDILPTTHGGNSDAEHFSYQREPMIARWLAANDFAKDHSRIRVKEVSKWYNGSELEVEVYSPRGRKPETVWRITYDDVAMHGRDNRISGADLVVDNRTKKK